MASIRTVAFAALGLMLFSLVNAGEPTRIDATTPASAEASWNRMLSESNDETKGKLRIALFQLNAAAAKGLQGLAYHLALEDISIFRVKDEVAGLTSNQIIELANQTPVE